MLGIMRLRAFKVPIGKVFRYRKESWLPEIFSTGTLLPMSAYRITTRYF
jgi:hypothetical protein